MNDYDENNEVLDNEELTDEASTDDESDIDLEDNISPISGDNQDDDEVYGGNVQIANSKILTEKQLRKKLNIHNGDDEETAEIKADLFIRNKYEPEELIKKEDDSNLDRIVQKLTLEGYDIAGHEAELAVKMNYGMTPQEAAEEIYTEAEAKQRKQLADPNEKYRRMLSAADRKACDRLKIAQPDRKWTYKKYYNRLKEFGL